MGVMSLIDALRKAGDLDVDLVEISPTAVPPVCRLMDYGKFKYQEQKKAAEAKSKQKVTHRQGNGPALNSGEIRPC